MLLYSLDHWKVASDPLPTHFLSTHHGEWGRPSPDTECELALLQALPCSIPCHSGPHRAPSEAQEVMELPGKEGGAPMGPPGIKALPHWVL